MTDLEIRRREALSRLASFHCFRQGEPDSFTWQRIRYFQHILEEVESLRREAAWMRPEAIQLLRDLEAGAVLYDPDFTMAHSLTYVAPDNRVHLRDSGYVLLYAIDCDVDQLKAEIEPVMQQIKYDAPRREAEIQAQIEETHRQWKRDAKQRDKRKKAEDEQPAEPATEDYVQPMLLELATA